MESAVKEAEAGKDGLAQPQEQAAVLSGAEAKLKQWTPDPALPAWFNEGRRRAIEAYFELAPPERSNESYHYADPRKFALSGFDTTAVKPGFSGAEYERICRLSREHGRVTCLSMVGDHVEEVLRNGSLAEQGVIVMPLHEALIKHAALIEPYWTQWLLPVDRDKLTAQHFATLDSGFFVYVPKEVAAADDIHLILESGESGTVVSPHILLVAERHSSARVFLHYLGNPEQGRNLQLSGLLSFIGEGAQVSVTKLQHLGPKGDAFSLEAARVGRDAKYTTITLNLGGGNVRTEVATKLAEPGADAQLFGLTIGRERQRLDYQTFQEHIAPHTSSNLLFKGALLGRARASYQGMILVHPEAQRTDAYQSNRTLVLSSQARSDSSPQLEIEANDVRCTHGSTTSNVRADEIFYLQARGIRPELARKLLVSGFLTEVADKIPLQALRDYVENFIMERMA